MSKIKMTKEQACRFLVLYHGLGYGFVYKGKEGIMDYVKKAGCLQFDTLNITGRNPDLVLQARIKAYKAVMLEELLYKDRKLVDEWDKEMSIYAVEDWPFFERNRKAAYDRYISIRQIRDFLPVVRETLNIQGPITSSDIDNDDIVDWAWAPTRLSRAALESMYLWGELIVYNKTNARKVYDFAWKHLPEEILNREDPNKTIGQYHQWNILRRIGAVGLLWNKASDAWLGIRELKSKERNEAFEELLKQGLLMELEIEGLRHPLYTRMDSKPLLSAVLEQKGKAPRAAFMAPLDNMLWDRSLIKELFGFEYRWEVYKPASQRQYGYYVLPVLYGSTFVGRFEPVLDKTSKTLNIKGWWWEPGIKVTKRMEQELQSCISRFMSFTEAETLTIDEQVRIKCSLDWLQG